MPGLLRARRRLRPRLGADARRAATDGHYVVNGQKVWSSYAHLADWCILVTLSDPDAPRYQGLTYLLVDMHSPGVEVRPLTQITGEAEFNEIFFADVEVPVENVARRARPGLAGGDDDADARAGRARVRALRRVRGRRRQAARAGREPRRSTTGSATGSRESGSSSRRSSDELPRADAADRRPACPGPEALGLRSCTGRRPTSGSASSRWSCSARRRSSTATATATGSTPAAQPRQHDRGRDVGDPPQHRRRARARAPEGARLVHFAFTDEQEPLRREARRWLDERYPPERVAELADSEAGWDPASWAELAELGWLGVSVAEEEGGAGLGFLEEAVLFEELGRALYPGPYFSTVALALPRLADRATARGRRRRGALVGRSVDGLVPDLGARRPRAGHAPTAPVAGRGRVARDDGLDAAGSAGSRPRRATRRRRDRPPRACARRSRSRRSGSRSARSSWGVEHAKDAQQFGKSIGVYQAVSHSLADALHGDRARRARSPTGPRGASPRATSRRRPRPRRRRRTRPKRPSSACERSIQVHGGIGFTWEHPLHRYYKRAQWIQAFDGFPARSARRSPRRSSPERTVLITGASSGIGAACATRLPRAAGRCCAGVRDDRATRRDGTTELILDVTDADAIARSRASGRRVGSTGSSTTRASRIAAPLEYLPLDELRRQLEVNVVGQLAVTQAVLPALRAAKGRIVHHRARSPGRSALPFLGAYAMSKHALEAMADSLRVELAPDGIDVSIVEPGTIAHGDLDEAAAAGRRRLRSATGARVERFRPMSPQRRSSEGRAGRPRRRRDRARAHRASARRRATSSAATRRSARRSSGCPTALRDRVSPTGVAR